METENQSNYVAIYIDLGRHYKKAFLVKGFIYDIRRLKVEERNQNEKNFIG